MKVKIERVIIGNYDYDSIIINADNRTTEIVFHKDDNVKQYENKTVDLVCSDGVYSIRPVTAATNKKNTD